MSILCAMKSGGCDVWRGREGKCLGEVVGKPEGNTPLVIRPVLDGIILQNRK